MTVMRHVVSKTFFNRHLIIKIENSEYLELKADHD